MSRSLSVSALPLKDEVDTFLLEVEVTKIIDDLNNLVSSHPLCLIASAKRLQHLNIPMNISK